MPYLILVSGPPGCGKTTLASGLARTLRAVHLDKDCIDDSFSPNDRGANYTDHIEPKVLDALLVLADRNLRHGLDVILDAPWSHIMLNAAQWQSRVKRLANDCSASLRVIECVIPSTLLRSRLAARGLERDRVKLLSDEAWRYFLATDRIGELVPLPHHAVDMTQAAERCLDQALAALSAAPQAR